MEYQTLIILLTIITLLRSGLFLGNYQMIK